MQRGTGFFVIGSTQISFEVFCVETGLWTSAIGNGYHARDRGHVHYQTFVLRTNSPDKKFLTRALTVILVLLTKVLMTVSTVNWTVARLLQQQQHPVPMSRIVIDKVKFQVQLKLPVDETFSRSRLPPISWVVVEVAANCFKNLVRFA